MLNRKGAAKTGTLIKLTQALVLLLFVSLLAFSAGTYIGKKVSDSEHRRAQLEGEYKGVAANEGAEAKDNGEEKLSEDEIASLTEEFVSKEKGEASREVASEGGGHGAPGEHGAPAAEHGASEAHGAPAESHPTAEAEGGHEGYKKYGSKTEPAAAAAESPKHSEAPKHVAASGHAEPPAHEAAPAPKHGSEPSPAAARVAEGHAPGPDPKEVRKPMSVLPSAPGATVGKYTVQVASYPEENDAKSRAADLKSKGWNAFYIPAEIQGKTWFRVSVGLFTSAKSATEFRKEFQKEANVDTAIVQKIVK